jgi:oxalate decarboxylase
MKRMFSSIVAMLYGSLFIFSTQASFGQQSSPFSTSSDPLLNGPTLPSFKFELNKQKDRVYEGGTAKEAGVTEFPVSKGIAGVDMYLKPGGLRELHWHANAAEWAYVLKGHCRVTVIDPEGRTEIADFGPGDVWYFPRGHGHSIQGIGDEECHFILVFDDGRFSEFSTFSASDWISKTPPAVLAKNFGTTLDTFADFPKKEVYIAQGKPPGALASDPGFRSENSPPLSHKYRLAAQKGLVFKGGTFQFVDMKKFPISTTMTGALQTLQPGALREMHWHPNADEWQYYISGHSRLEVFGANGRVRIEEMNPGDVGYVPQGFGHYIENASDKEDCQTLIVLDNGNYQEISLADWIRSQPMNVLETNFGVSRNILEKLLQKQGFIAAPTR